MDIESNEPTRLLCRFLRAHRLARGWSRSLLAEKCNTTTNPVPGISHVSIRFWETCHENRVPSAAQLAVLAEALGWSDRQLGAAAELLRLDIGSTSQDTDATSAGAA